MSELTPERVRDAAEVLRQLADPMEPPRSWMSHQLDARANTIERDLAAEAKREKRIQDLGREIYDADARNNGYRFDSYPYVHPVYDGIARTLLDRYPSLMNGGE